MLQDEVVLATASQDTDTTLTAQFQLHPSLRTTSMLIPALTSFDAMPPQRRRQGGASWSSREYAAQGLVSKLESTKLTSTLSQVVVRRRAFSALDVAARGARRGVAKRDLVAIASKRAMKTILLCRPPLPDTTNGVLSRGSCPLEKSGVPPPYGRLGARRSRAPTPAGVSVSLSGLRLAFRRTAHMARGATPGDDARATRMVLL